MSDPGSTFFANLADKDKLIAPVKDRGNVSYKQQRFRAAIADYTTALRLWYSLFVIILQEKKKKNILYL